MMVILEDAPGDLVGVFVDFDGVGVAIVGWIVFDLFEIEIQF